MEETRSDLANKLSALEHSVSGTVQTATNAVETTKDAVSDTVNAVSGTVESVKETVENVTEKLQDTVAGVTESVQDAVAGVKESFDETVRSVTETFNLKLQCERHPWAVFGGAVAVGAIGGYLLGGSSRKQSTEHTGSSFAQDLSHSAESRGGSGFQTPARTQSAEQSGDSISGWLFSQLGGLKGLAVGAAMSVARDLIAQALPDNLKERVASEVDNLTKSLGGEPVKGSLLPEPSAGDAEQSNESHGSQAPANYGGLGRSGQSAMAGARRTFITRTDRGPGPR